ncbi:MAG: hypothetical protein ACYC5A_09775 [Thermoleophilia bacterium]
MVLAGLALAACLSVAPPAEAAGLSVVEAPLATGPGDQVDPDIRDGEVFFNDRATAPGRLFRQLVGGGPAALVAGPGITAGPALDDGAFAWLTPDGLACMAPLSGGAENCVSLPAPAEALAYSSGRAVTSHDNKVIRLVNFGAGRTKVLDSSTTSGGRYDPDVDGDRAVWVRDRGYAGQYYEPVIVDYDLSSDTYVYLTALGGGAASSGESRYERAQPSLGDGEVVYQQRIREPGEQWDIYRAVSETYGLPLVAEPGDQVNPALDGGILVYQDNRGGHLDESGEWVGEWDLYIKDLATGIETPLCTAAGDQVNPRISGNVVVWQDNRSGDWDVYGAVLGQANPSPALSVRVEAVFWADYAAYLARELSVRYSFANQGAVSADAFALRAVDTIPATVSVVALPEAVGIAPGASAAIDVRYQVPQGVALFKTALFASCSDGAGGELWFPRRPAGVG